MKEYRQEFPIFQERKFVDTMKERAEKQKRRRRT